MELTKVAICLLGLSLLLHTTASAEMSTLDHLKPSADTASQEDAARDLIKRLLPNRAKEFSVTVDPSIGPKSRDTFQLETKGNELHVTGTTGVAVAWGVYHYLAQYCDCHISWAGDQLHVPEALPKLTTPLTVTSNDRFRYYQNVCTVSYSFAWWDWSRWEREIDWMALNGINLPLAFNGQEAIWQRVYLKMGFTQDELNGHFGGPAFLAWSRMGNIHGWGGPLSTSWHQQQVALQHKILTRMRSLGMIPVLPAFAGHVPEAIHRVFPKANVSKLAAWGHFNETYSCTTLLEAQDPLFPKIGKAFLTEYIKEFGTDHIYNADTFNELTPRSSDPSYLHAAGKAVYDGMLAGDDQAIWLMQGWLFLSPFWKPPQAKALLTSVPKGHMIVLDLFSDVSPLYRRLDSYYGQPFIWCMLHNFGGALAMYGAIERVNEGPSSARSWTESTMVGIGLTPEGINQNNVIYEFMLENSWRSQPRNVTEWISSYARRRYGTHDGQVDQAWQLLKGTVYNCTDTQRHHSRNLIIHRPSKRNKIDVWYNTEEFFRAWDLLVQASGSRELAQSSLFRYDLVDVTRQALQVTAIHFYNQMLKGYKAERLEDLLHSGKQLLDLLGDLDLVLATDEHFLLGRWLESSHSVATSQAERLLYELNARAQITTWGPDGEILDYANKQWSGLVNSYYRPRWDLFVLHLKKSLMEGVPFNQTQFDVDVFREVERPFIEDTSRYTNTTHGDQIKTASAIHKKYRPVTMEQVHFFRRLPQWSEQEDSLTKHTARWMDATNHEAQFQRGTEANGLISYL